MSRIAKNETLKRSRYVLSDKSSEVEAMETNNSNCNVAPAWLDAALEEHEGEPDQPESEDGLAKTSTIVSLGFV